MKKRLLPFMLLPFLLAGCGENASSSAVLDDSSKEADSSAQSLEPNQITKESFQQIGSEGQEKLMELADDTGSYFKRVSIQGFTSTTMKGQTKSTDVDVTFTYTEVEYGHQWVADKEGEEADFASSYLNYDTSIFLFGLSFLEIKEDNLKYYQDDDGTLRVDGDYTSSINLGFSIEAKAIVDYRFDEYGLAYKLVANSSGYSKDSDGSESPYSSQLNLELSYSI